MEEFKQQENLALKQKEAEIYEKLVKLENDTKKLQNENSLHEQEQNQILSNKKLQEQTKLEQFDNKLAIELQDHKIKLNQAYNEKVKVENDFKYKKEEMKAK
jgi:hypothetical protein